MIVLVSFLIVGWFATGSLASASGQQYAGRPLGDVLRELQAVLLSFNDNGFPFLSSFGVRYRF